MCSSGQNQKLKINEIKANLVISRHIHCIRNIVKTIKEIFDAIFCGFEIRILVDKIIFPLIYIQIHFSRSDLCLFIMFIGIIILGVNLHHL